MEGKISSIINFSKKMLISEKFNCGVCKKHLLSQIFLTKNFGNVCYPCKVRIEVISTDVNQQTEEKLLRNDVLEMVIKNTLFPCKYCNSMVISKQLEKHEQDCPSLKLKCCDKCVKILPKHFLNHFIQEHAELLVDCSFRECVFNIPLAHDEDNTIIKLLNNQVSPFFIKIITCLEKDKLFFSLYNAKYNTNIPTDSSATIKLIGINNKSMEMNCDIKNLRRLNEETEKLFVKISTLEKLIDAKKTVTVFLKFKTITKSNTELIKKGNILSHFECPICMNMMTSQIFQCENGHSLCGECKKKISQCPSCRKKVENIRNFSLETIFQSLQ